MIPRQPGTGKEVLWKRRSLNKPHLEGVGGFGRKRRGRSKKGDGVLDGQAVCAEHKGRGRESRQKAHTCWRSFPEAEYEGKARPPRIEKYQPNLGYFWGN